MRTSIIIYLSLHLSIHSCAQQPVRALEINREIYPILKSLYGKIEVVDNRLNKNIIIQYDSLDRYSSKTKYILQPDLKSQVENFYKEHIGSIAQFINKKVLFVIHDYNVHNDYGTNSLKIKGDLFLADKEKFYQLVCLDTIIFGDESNINVFFNNHSGSIYSLLLNSALSLPDYSKSYNKYCTEKVDSLIKSRTSFYNAENLVSGIYYNYSNLMKLQPNFKVDDEIGIQADSDIQNILNKIHGIEYDSIYALVANNALYIPIRKKWYKMEKLESDYYCDLKIDYVYIKKGQSQNLGKEFLELKNEYYKGFSYLNPVLVNLMVYGFSSPWFKFKLNCRTGHLSFVKGIVKPKKSSKSRKLGD